MKIGIVSNKVEKIEDYDESEGKVNKTFSSKTTKTI